MLPLWLATAMASPPEELGLVDWGRDFEAGQRMANASGRPMLLLFDEVPGCSTVKAYGAGTLSHPLVVDAAASLFVAVAVYNNVAGEDRRVLELYDEPTWNNPVVRIVDADGTDLVPRLTGDWSAGALFERMSDALVAAGGEVPPWLALVSREARADTQTSTYAMGCFWSGENHLGAHDGVLGTRTGWQGGREVVQVTWDPEGTSAADLDRWAHSARMSSMTEGQIRATPGDDRHTIRGTAWAAVPMTAAQASRVNADVAAGRDASRWLAPSQRALHASAVTLGGGWDAGLGQVPLAEGYERAHAAIARRTP